MAKSVHFGVAGKARKGRKLYIGIAGKARKAKKAPILREDRGPSPYVGITQP